MTPHRHARASVGLALGAALSLAPAAGAQIAVSANDNKVVSLNGVVTVVPNAPPDTVSVIDLKASPPRVIAEVEAPVSVVGPPLSIAVTPDESLAPGRQPHLRSLDRRVQGRVHEARHDGGSSPHRARHRVERLLRHGRQPRGLGHWR